MKRKMIITAANGFMGRHLVNFFSEEYQVVALTRKPYNCKGQAKNVLWDGRNIGEWKHEFEGAFAVINLAGKSVDCRYNKRNQDRIFHSRMQSTKVIGQAIQGTVNRPRIWINAASATYYKHSLDVPMTEENGMSGTGFSVDVCRNWERVFYSYSSLHIRQVALRTAIVLGKDGGALPTMRKLAKFWVGGMQGDGKQQFSWIHINDFCRSVEHIIQHNELTGPINISSPCPVRNVELMRYLRVMENRSFGVKLPVWLLEIGAFFIRTETELVLKSRYVLPDRLLHSGFQFNFALLEDALDEIKAAENKRHSVSRSHSSMLGSTPE